MTWSFVNYANEKQATFLKAGKWTFPPSILIDVAKHNGLGDEWRTDAWGNPLSLMTYEKKRANTTGWTQLDFHEIISAGPDGRFGTDDDIRIANPNDWNQFGNWYANGTIATTRTANTWLMQEQGQMRGMMLRDGAMNFAMQPQGAGGFGGGGRGGFAPAPAAAPAFKAAKGMIDPLSKDKEERSKEDKSTGQSGGVAPTRVRDYFPETMLWQPSLITDDKGIAVMPVHFADSITTWHLTASASTRGGLLGGTTLPLRVFQDFFVEPDMPVFLTRNDQVNFPVAVYNYLKSDQKVTLELKKADWFELIDGQGFTRTVDLKAGEIKAVSFNLKALRVGRFPVSIEARGDKLSDAVQREMEVVPDGRKVEQVFTDRIKDKVAHTLTLPKDDATKLLVKLYPGVFSQILEGSEGILRMPGGCFEQTSSSAYPNILVVDYIKKTKMASPAILLQAETYLNAGYQRLLTFEHKTGGFDWWGQEQNEPLIWLSAYGLHEFTDMDRVMTIDHGVIDRTRAWLFKQQGADGTWSKIGATHSESIERMGDPKLLLTSYVTWALLESDPEGGKKDPRIKKAIEYIRTEAPKADSAYILALAANALACWDPKDDSTHATCVLVLKKLDEKKVERAEWKATMFPAPGGQSLSYARGDSLTVETTAMAVLAMLKNGQFTNSVNSSLTYLVKSKDPHGTWGSTQATILALKAMVQAAGGARQKGEATFTVAVNGKDVKTGVINDKNDDIMQSFDLTEFLQAGLNDVTLEVKGETNLMYQVVGRHYESWGNKEKAKPQFNVAVDYDRTKLSTKDMLKAKATLKYNGKEPTSMVILDLGIPPGFTVEAGDFAEMVASKKVNKFNITSRQVILYLGDVKPDEVLTFEYTLKPKYPIKAKTPATVAYEYYTPANKGTAPPIELVVEERK